MQKLLILTLLFFFSMPLVHAETAPAPKADPLAAKAVATPGTTEVAKPQATTAATDASKPDEEAKVDAPMPTPVGRVVWVKGTLKAVMPNKEERSLQKTSIIYLHDTLITPAGSQAQIVFTDNTLMTFRPETKFVIDQYSYTPQKKSKSVGKYIMNLLEGGFRTITGLIAKSNPSDYQVNTPVATIGVRGTDYAVYLKAGQIYVGFYAGSPCVNGKAGSLCLDSKNPYAFMANKDAAPVPLQQQPAVFHEKLNVVPTKITPFSANTSGVTTQQLQTRPVTPRGVVGSFCITQ